MFELSQVDERKRRVECHLLKIVVERKGRDKSAEGSGVHGEEQRAEYTALRNITGRGI